MTFLSVLIPTYNRPDQLEVALASLRFFDVDMEVIVGNNGDFADVDKVVERMSDFLHIQHLNNPAGSTYPENIQTLVAMASGEWLTILHDDDFFTEEASCIPMHLLTGCDFLFSDHWIADQRGKIIPDRSGLNTQLYQRCGLKSGSVKDLELLCVNNIICHDCFFVKTSIVKSCIIDSSLKYFADILLLAQISSMVSYPSYIAERCFAYRLSDISLTAKGIPQDELLEVLRRCLKIICSEEARHALSLRIVRQARYSLRYSIKRGKLKSAIYAARVLVRLA